MAIRKKLSAALAMTIAFTPVQQAAAGSGDVVGGIIGGIIGGAIANSANQPRRTTTTRRSSGASSAQRAENREVQTALNYFGFPAGTPDGVMGRRSRGAISSYQAFMGYAPSGRLSTYEKDFLITSYNRALAGGPVTMQQIASNPHGPKGLLIQYRNAMATAGSMAPTYAAPQAQPAPQQQPATTVIVNQPPAQAAPAAPQVRTAKANAPAAAAAGGALGGLLPSFEMTGEQVQSAARRCNNVLLVINTAGGIDMSQPQLAREQLFCLERADAIRQSEEMVANVRGLNAGAIEAQCLQLGTTMADQVKALSLKDSATIKAEVSQFVLDNGLTPAQATGTAKICLGVGYRKDDMDTAVGSAMILVALGALPYSELLGHHLTLGFGAGQRTDLATGWYEESFRAYEAGATAPLLPGYQNERQDMLYQATYGSAPNAQAAPAPAQQKQGGLPAFNVVQ